MTEIRKVGVVGGGLMGHGIAQITAQAGCSVVLREVDEQHISKTRGKIDRSLSKIVEKGNLTEDDAEAIKQRIQSTTDYKDLADCELVIEAITEDINRKLEMWREVDAIAADKAYFATNTSSLSVIAQASATSRPDRFFGLHFFNPPQAMKLVEVIRCLTTSDDTLQTGIDFAKSLKKLAVVTKDQTGFIVNRLLVPYLLDAIRAYGEGVGSIPEIDTAMKAGLGHPMGPLTLADFVGLDTMSAICDEMFQEFRERRFAQPPLLRKLVTAGWYGRKSGMGFYDYSGDSPIVNPNL